MNRKIIFYNPKLKKLASHLRKNSTLAEVLLWKCVKGKQVKGYDFHRQKPIGNYIVDFFCPQLRLAIEIDGYSHQFKYESDEKKQNFLEECGFHLLRFSENVVRKDIQSVVRAIENWIKENEGNNTPRPSDTPLKRG